MLLVALGVARANVYIDRFLKSSQLKILGASKLATSFHRASFLTPENENTERALSLPLGLALYYCEIYEARIPQKFFAQIAMKGNESHRFRPVHVFSRR